MQLVEQYFETSALMVRPPHEILRIARILLTDISLWTQGARARDALGKKVKPHDPRAVCWSLNGAIAIASNPHGITPPGLLMFLTNIVKEWRLIVLLYKADEFELWEDVDDFNDQRPHRFILALLDEAITRLETQ